MQEVCRAGICVFALFWEGEDSPLHAFRNSESGILQPAVPMARGAARGTRRAVDDPETAPIYPMKLAETQDTIASTARHAFQDVKDAAQNSLLQPIADGTREVVRTAQEGCNAMARSTSEELLRLEKWAAKHPTRAAGIVFAVGVLTVLCLFRK